MMHFDKPWWVCAALLGALVLCNDDAFAQAPTAASAALAEARFEEGRDLFKQERFAEACAKFEESQKLEQKLGTLLRLALCHEKIGKNATAWAEYTSVAAIASREGQDEREQFARKQIETLNKLIAYVTVKVPSPQVGLVVMIDGQLLGRDFLDKPLPIDPGSHHITATAPDKKNWSTIIEVPPTKAEIPVEIPILESLAPPATPAKEPSPEVVTTPAPVVPAPIAPKPPAPTADRTGTTLMYVGFGAGAAGLLLGSITGGVALGKAGPLIEACPRNHCPETQRQELAAVNTMANVANIGFGLGIVGAVVGIVGIVKGGGSAPSSSAALVTPIVGPGAIGFTGRF